MPYNLQIVKPSDFVRLDAKGQTDVEETRRILKSVAKACVDRGIDRALLDARDVPPSLTLSDLYSLAVSFREMGFYQDHRLAILHRYTATERAEFFAMCASERGWNVRAFDNYEEAIEWFNEPSTESIPPPQVVRFQRP